MAVKFGKDGTLYCNTVRYNWKVTRNLVADGTNAKLGGTGAWDLDVSNVNLSTLAGTFYFGTGYCMLKQTMPAPVAGHKYYGAVKFSAQNGFSCDDGRLEWQMDDAYSLTFAQHAFSSGTGGRYVISSDIKELSTVPSGTWYVRLFTVGANVTSTYKNIIIVDLTAAFGAGNEPTKEWCDQNIIEHNLLNNVGDHLVPTPTTTTYKFGNGEYYVEGLSSTTCYNYRQLNSVVYPRDSFWYLVGNASNSEGFVYTNNSSYVDKNTIEYFQVFHGPLSKAADATSIACYHPIAEPYLGAVTVKEGSKFNGSGSMGNWKKDSGFSSRSSFTTGNYPVRLDFDNQNIKATIFLTGFFVTTANSQVTWYNYNINNGVDIDINDVNKEWCERWVGGPLNSIIHIKHHLNTSINFNTDYDIVCNDIEIRPEQNKIYFDKTGTIVCKKLVKVQAW